MASRSWNRVELIGNLTRDPELRYTPNGAAVCTFGLATNRSFVSEGERKEEVDFHRLVAWNKLAELCNQLLKKGLKVFVSGRLQTRSWEGQDGQTKQVTEIVVEDMIVLSPKGEGLSVQASEEVSLDEVSAPREKTERSVVKETSLEEKKEEKPKVAASAPKEEVKEEEIDDLPF
ncbi:single-stranded DNA-binding protein [Candidatus Daviesbacteria bacterium]|nr:single-stranded DNA-binding protein [Candidatus Daviesbacteria bacterium]